MRLQLNQRTARMTMQIKEQFTINGINSAAQRIDIRQTSATEREFTFSAERMVIRGEVDMNADLFVTFETVDGRHISGTLNVLSYQDAIPHAVGRFLENVMGVAKLGSLG